MKTLLFFCVVLFGFMAYWAVTYGWQFALALSKLG